MMRRAAFTGSAFLVLAALSGLTSEAWLASGYGTDGASASHARGGDEAYWLTRGAVPTTPASVAVPPVDGQSGTFAVGNRLVVEGASKLNLDIVSVVPAAAGSGLVDGEGRPLLVVTARERNGLRMVRVLVEADRIPATGEKSL